MEGFSLFDRQEDVKLIEALLDFVKGFSKKVNFFIPKHFLVVSKEKLRTILMDPILKKFIQEKAEKVGYESLFIKKFFETSKQSSKEKFVKGRK